VGGAFLAPPFFDLVALWATDSISLSISFCCSAVSRVRIWCRAASFDLRHHGLLLFGRERRKREQGLAETLLCVEHRFDLELLLAGEPELFRKPLQQRVFAGGNPAQGCGCAEAAAARNTMPAAKQEMIFLVLLKLIARTELHHAQGLRFGNRSSVGSVESEQPEE